MESLSRWLYIQSSKMKTLLDHFYFRYLNNVMFLTILNANCLSWTVLLNQFMVFEEFKRP